MKSSTPISAALVCTAFLTGFAAPLAAHPHHDEPSHRGPTYEVTAPVQLDNNDPRLVLQIVDAASGQPLAARFSLVIDGQPFVPAALGRHGLRFVSIHQGKKQRFTVTYARGSGAVEVPVPKGAGKIAVHVVKGFEYLPTEAQVEVAGGKARATVKLSRWIDMPSRGWLAAEEHLHYERSDPAHDRDWLTMMDGDGLEHAHFLVLKGGNLPGVWAQQYAYGKRGEAVAGKQWIRAGEEFRDGAQGHINLLGIGELIEPISTGGIGRPSPAENHPPLHDVFLQARKSGGIGGPAHGGAYSASPTAALDTVLGAVDFFEIANTHLYNVELWYRLLNCGYITPPVAGTDLPNFPFRDRWQPLLGEVRTYVEVGDRHDFESWKEAVRQGKTFITSGPLIELSVNGVGPGGTVKLPGEGGEIEIEAVLAGPRKLASLEIVQSGVVVAAKPQQSYADSIHRLGVRRKLKVTNSCWFAARGTGVAKQALAANTDIDQSTLAHTAVVQVLVGDQPITSSDDTRWLIDRLNQQQEYYRTRARYKTAEHRSRMLKLFDRAIAAAEQRREKGKSKK